MYHRLLDLESDHLSSRLSKTKDHCQLSLGEFELFWLKFLREIKFPFQSVSQEADGDSNPTSAESSNYIFEDLRELFWICEILFKDLNNAEKYSKLELLSGRILHQLHCWEMKCRINDIKCAKDCPIVCFTKTSLKGPFRLVPGWIWIIHTLERCVRV